MPTVLRRPAQKAASPVPLVQPPVLPRLTIPSPSSFSRAPSEPEEVEEEMVEEADASSQDYEVGDPTVLPTPTTRWLRTARTAHATRSDGIVLWHEGAGWHVTVHAEPFAFFPLTATPAHMEDCIARIDMARPPEPWMLVDGVWMASVWRVFSLDALTWSVYRDLDGELAQASRQTFVTADRARRWAELRFDRGSAGLRGPKPRVGARSKAKLPDVRVTEDERTRMQAALERVGMSYSEMVRASAYWVEENLLGQNAGWKVERLENGVVRFARV